MAAIDAVGMLQQSSIDKVVAVLLDNVHQTETELEFRNKLEEREVEVASHTDFQIKVERFEPQSIVLASREVDHRIDTSNEVGAEIVIAWRSELHVNRHRDIGALEHLRRLLASYLLMIDGMFLSEVDTRRKTQGEVVVQAKVAKHANRKARAEVVNLRIPLLARLRVDVAIVLQLHVLQVHTQEEAIVEASLVDVRAILHPAFLCYGTQGKSEYGEQYKAP